MPMYSYKGYDAGSGANVKGRIDADSERSARASLRQRQKIIVAEIKEEKASTEKNGGLKFSLTQRSVSVGELAVMVRQFATLQNAYVPVDESLKALVSQVENDALRNTLSSVKDAVSEGKSLAEASSAYPNVFNKLYVNMVKAGESSGTLGLVLERTADFMEYQVAVRGKVVGAMVYPSIMICVSGAIVVFLLVVIVPKLSKVFQSMKVKVPWYTELLINFSTFLQNYWFVPIVLIVVGFFAGRSWLNTTKGRRKFDQWLITSPIIGPVFLMLGVSRFTKTLSTLLSSGVPIIAALDITKNVVNNMIMTEVLEQAKVEVQEGNSLAACINKSGIFPGLVTHMIATGEKTGQLVTMLAHVAKAYDAEVERKISKLITLIEPIMMMLLMVIAVTVIGGMLMPMMDIMKEIK